MHCKYEDTYSDREYDSWLTGYDDDDEDEAWDCAYSYGCDWDK